MRNVLDRISRFLESRDRVLVLYVVLVVAAVGIAVFSSATTYDYENYGGQWRHVLTGANPWDYARGDMRRFNAYGPLHSLLAYPYSWSSHLPKVVYALASILATIYLISLAIDERRLDQRTRATIVLFLVANPALWILYVHGGFNDALVGSLFLFGAIAYDRERYVLSASALGLAILYKFTPIFVVPFLCIRRRRPNWGFAVPLAIILVLGFGLAYLKWGAELAAPIQVGMHRHSTSASIFAFFRQKYSPLHYLGIADIDFLSMYLLVLSWLALLVCHLVFDLSARRNVVLVMSTIFLFYKVAHIQFYFSLVLLLVYLVIEEYQEIRDRSPALLRSIGIFLLWLCCVVAAWKIPSRAWKQQLHAVIGLPTFALHLWMNIALAGYVLSRRSRGANPHSTSAEPERPTS